jgi:SAM-dependent methyltransferase
MNEREKEDIIRLYEDRLGKYGQSIKTMGWRDQEQQHLRFRILSEIKDLNAKKILDVGCGFGDFYDYLVEKGINVDYSGFDISKRIIDVAKNRHPHLKFEVKDILTEKIDQKYDYIFESGILNKKLSDNYRYAKAIITAMYSLCNEGISFNMMTNYVDFEEDYLFYYSPENIFRFCKSLSKFVVIRHEYPLFEFTVYIFKDKKDKGKTGTKNIN